MTTQDFFIKSSMKESLSCDIPSLSFFYHHRQSWKELLRHTYFRGPKFLDYYLTPGGPLFKKYCLAWLLVILFSLLKLCFSHLMDGSLRRDSHDPHGCLPLVL